MPTFTAIALDSLLEHGASRSVEKSSNDTMPVPESKPPNHSKPIPNLIIDRSDTSFIGRKIARPQMTPALYATPEATPVPDSPSSYSPSPYIINHKRRGPSLSRIVSEEDLLVRQRTNKVNGGEEVGEEAKEISFEDDIPPSLPISNESKDEQAEDLSVSNVGSSKKDSMNGFHEVGSNGLGNGVIEELGFAAHVPVTPGKEGDGDWFFDPLDSLSYASNTDDEDCGTAERSVKFTRSRGEFFDAQEELSSDSGAQSSLNDLEEELRGLRLSLLMEMERRKQAEETLSHVRSNWKRIREQLSQAGVTLPENMTMEAEPLDADTAEELCRQVDLVRFVSEAIGRGLAKAEAEAVMEAVLEAKNFEVSRLLDRVHFYETVNHEMSQRNQEVVESSRRRRQQRKRRQRWIWGMIAVAASVGASTLAWSYMQPGGDPSSTSHGQESEHANGNRWKGGLSRSS